MLIAGSWEAHIEVNSRIVPHGTIAIEPASQPSIDRAASRPGKHEAAKRHNSRKESQRMSANIIISYDGTYNEDDALALGRVFARAGAQVSLAYVRHAQEEEASREILAQHEALSLLQRGAELLGDRDTPCHVVTDRSTPEGLSALAERIGADAIVFCSDSHTAKGHIAVGNSARRLLDGGRHAIAIAPAGFAKSGDGEIRVIVTAGDGSAQATAEGLARSLGGELSTATDREAGLLVVGSRPDAEVGRVSLSAASENLIELATCPVLVVPHGKALSFDGSLIATA